MLLVNWIGFGFNTVRVDNSYLILNDYFELPVHQEGEILVDFKDSVEALEAVRDVVIEGNFPVNYITEVKEAIWKQDAYIMFCTIYLAYIIITCHTIHNHAHCISSIIIAVCI